MQQEVNMAFWLRKVWGWKKEKRQDDSYVSQFFAPLFTLFTLFFLSLLHLSFDLFLFLRPPLFSQLEHSYFTTREPHSFAFYLFTQRCNFS